MSGPTGRTSHRLAAAVLAAAVAATGGVAIGAAAPAGSAGMDSHGLLANPALQARYENITDKLRCLVCQNETVADSDAELAAELRDEVRNMLLQGKSDADIYAFMKARYGEFVLYDPPLDARTVFIWGAPFALLLVGAAVIYRVVRARSKMPLDEASTPGST